MKPRYFWLSLIVGLIGCAQSASAAAPGSPSNLRFGDAPRAGIYLGVPDPAGMVPAAIMPALPPAGGDIQAFPYDPINLETPAYTGAANQYWIDGSDPACSDAGNGTQAVPRCTLPGYGGGASWTIAANSQLFIAGDGHTYGQNQNINLINFAGTESEPIWFIGVTSTESSPRWTNQPKLNFRKLDVGDAGSLTHVLFDNVHFYHPTDGFRFLLDKSDPASTGTIGYLTIRHSTCSGSGTSDPFGTESSSARCLSLSGRIGNEVKFVVLYDNDLFGLGRWLDDYTTSKDNHGVQPQGAMYYFWYLNNRSYHLQGDSIQCSNSNQFDAIFARRPHYIYIAGNTFFENYENAYDSKGCYHVIFSENHVYNFKNDQKAANGSPIIAANDAESYIGNRFEWFINNRIENVGDAVSYKGTSQDAFVYFLGNLVTNINVGAAVPIAARCTFLDAGTFQSCGDGMFFAMNTIDCGQQVSVVEAPQNGKFDTALIPQEEQDQEMTFVGNIFLECLDDGGSPYRFEGINDNWLVTHSYNVDYRSTGGNITLQAPPLQDVKVGNLTNVDPLIVNQTNTLAGDYSLQAGSPARKIVPEPSAYATFRTMYGLDIRQDVTGRAWRAGSSLNAGAYQ